MSVAKAMEYQATPVKSSLTNKQVALKELERLSTSSIIWHLLKRHKTGVLATWAGLMTALYIYPPLPQLLAGLLGY